MISGLCAECRDSSSPFAMSFRLQSSFLSSSSGPMCVASPHHQIIGVRSAAVQCSGGCHAVHDCGADIVRIRMANSFFPLSPLFLSRLLCSFERVKDSARTKIQNVCSFREERGRCSGRARAGGRGGGRCAQKIHVFSSLLVPPPPSSSRAGKARARE